MIAIDLGSNTIRCIEFDGENWGKSFETVVRTAESLHRTNKIGSNAVIRIIDAIHNAKECMDFNQPIIAYTTAAMRLAENSDDVIREILLQTGIVFEIIDAQKEALLTLAGVIYRLTRLGIQEKKFIVVDIGGGSTEFSHYDGDLQKTFSLDMGIVTLSESAFTRDKLLDQIGLFQQIILNEFGHINDARLVFTAGTPTTIAAFLQGMDYVTYDPNKVNGFLLYLEDCKRVYRELLAMDENTRRRFVGVGRESLIMTGILMVQAVYESFMTSEALVIDDGLREGIALDYFKIV